MMRGSSNVEINFTLSAEGMMEERDLEEESGGRQDQDLPLGMGEVVDLGGDPCMEESLEETDIPQREEEEEGTRCLLPPKG